MRKISNSIYDQAAELVARTDKVTIVEWALLGFIAFAGGWLVCLAMAYGAPAAV